jgi:DNA polymerase/3'-5' exonuclease PolX
MLHPKTKLVVDRLHELSDLLESDAHRSAAFLRAAISITHTLPEEDISQVFQHRKIPHVGDSTKIEIAAFLETGTSRRLEALRYGRQGNLEAFQATLLEQLCTIPGVGPAKALWLLSQHGITSLDDLSQKIASGTLRDEVVIRGTKLLLQAASRLPRALVTDAIQNLMTLLLPYADHTRLSLAGAYRRKCPTIKKIKILLAPVQGVKPDTVCEEIYETLSFHGYQVEREGAQKLSIQVQVGFQVRACVLSIVPQREYACALLALTGSKAFTTALRGRLHTRGMTLTAHRIALLETPKTVLYPKSEAEIFLLAACQYRAPEERIDASSVVAM